MDKQNLIIYNFKAFYEIFKELEESINFKIFVAINIKSLNEVKKNLSNYLILTKKKIDNENNQFVLVSKPINIFKLIEHLNIQSLKHQFSEKSKLFINKYNLDLNSRELIKDDKKLKLTEKESELIIYLSKCTDPVDVNELQKEVWDYHSKLETHTVETHIYRLRKKIYKIFNDKEFIISKKNGYQIT
mgnify:FL=1